MSEAVAPGQAGMRRVPSGLIALTPGTLERTSASVHVMLEVMERAAAAAIEGGVRAIVVREPSLVDGAFLELAQRVRARLDVAAPDEGWLAVHDRLHLAEPAGADAVHLGGKSLPLAAARSVVGPRLAIGVSSHAGDSVDYAEADVHFHAPAFEPTSKPLYGRDVLGWDGLERFAAAARRPVFALGGITLDRLQERALDPAVSSLAGVALIGALWGTDQTPIRDGARSLRDVARISTSAAQLTELAQTVFVQREGAES